MDSWLKCHVAILFPSIAPATFAAGLDRFRLARTRDLVLLAPLLRKMARRKEIEIALIGHASAARDELQHLAREFLVLRDQSGVATPAIDRLLPYLDPATPLMPDGSREIRLRWW